MWRFFIMLVVFVLAFSVSTGVQANSTPTVTDLKMMRNPNGQTRLLLSIDAAVPYRSFVLGNPARVVIDLPRMNWAAPLNKGDRNRIIRSYKMGAFEKNTLRLVLNLQRPAVIISQTRLAPENGKNWHYIFDLKPVDPLHFQRAIKEIKSGGDNDTLAAPKTGLDPVPPNTFVTPPPATPRATQTAALAAKKPLIVIDAGHGGVDPGALATNGTYEKHITLATAKELGRLLQASGKYRVKLTRDRDIYIKLPERVRIARAASADLFVSLHADTISRPNVQGASVYTLSETASDAETAKLAERENAVDSLVNVNVGDVDADVADILIDLVTRDTMNQSKVLAETVVQTFKQSGIHTLPILPHRSAGFAVLKSPDIPSVLIEMGYLSNREEADNLASDAYRKKLAAAVAKIVERYFNETSKASY